MSVNRVESQEQIETFFDSEKIAREGKQLCKEAIAALEKTEHVAKIILKFSANYANNEIDLMKARCAKDITVELETKPPLQNLLPSLLKGVFIENSADQYGGLNNFPSFNFSFTLSLYGSHGTLLKERTWKVQK